MARQPAKTLYSKVESPYQQSTGEAIGTFFTEMKNNKRLMAKKCDKCGRVFCPPQEYCEFCWDLMKEWVQVDDRGTITAWTVVKHYYPGMPGDLPFAYVLIKLKGADTALLHIVKYSNLDALAEGVEVEAVWKDDMDRKGNIFDISYFKVLA